MGTLNSWDVIDANNNATPPDGWPENTMNYSDVNDTGRAVQGTIKRFFADINGSLDAGGVADAYTLTLNETGYTAYFDGMLFACTIPVTNATATPTLDVNGIGAATIVDNKGNALGIGALEAGGVYTFQHDGTNLRVAGGGSGAIGGSDGQVQYNNNGVAGGAVGLTYNDGNDEVTITNPLNLSSDIVLTEQADHTSTPAAGFGYLWVRDDAPTQLIFTDDAGNDTVLGAGGGGTPALPLNSVQFNNAGSFGGSANFTFNGTNVVTVTGQLNVSATGVLGGQVMTITGDPTTGRVINLTSTGSGEALRVSGGSPAIEVVTGGIDILGGAGLSVEDGSGSCTFSQNGTTESRITSGLNAGDLQLQSAEPGSEIRMLHRDGADLFTRTSFDADAFTVRMYSNGNEIVNVDQTDVNINRLVNLSNASAGQIQFPATQNPSSNLNTLDDYEEDESFAATFTPTTSGTITIDGSNDELAYVKIGRLVWLQGEISVLSVSSPVGNVEVPLPFTSWNASAAGQDQLYQSCWIVNLSGLPDDFYTFFIDRGSNVGIIQQFDGITPIADNFQATTIVSINVLYMAQD